jgi:CRISPR-associated protein Cst1
MKSQATRIDLTGNPFVDTGLAVIASLAGLEDVTQLTLKHVRSVHGDGKRLTFWNSSLSSCFITVFTKNSVLTNSSMKDKRKRTTAYTAVVNSLLQNIGSDERPFRCEACGDARSLDFSALCDTAIPRDKQQATFVGRDWFPLAGSLGSDAQALPSASRAAHLCARCLFAVHYLPLGLILLAGC